MSPLHEVLEPRALLNGALSVQLSSTGTLRIIGSEAPDVVTVAFAGDRVATTVNGQTQDFPRSHSRRVVVEGRGGNDRVHNRTNLRSTLLGQAGRDTLIGGRANDVLQGGQGADVLFWSPAFDSYYGGVELDAQDDGSPDVVDFSLASARLSLRYSIAQGNVYAFVGVSDLPNNDDLPSTGERHVLDPDTIEIVRLSGFDDDTDFGDYAFGVVTIYGGDGAETIYNGFDHLTFFGESGDDFVLLGNGGGFVNGGEGNDTIRGGDGPDSLTGGSGDDSIVGLRRNDSLDGGEGDDTLRGGEGDDALIGGPGRDRLYGNLGNDLLLGRGGSKDRLDGSDGDDTATADAGPDVVDLLVSVEHVR